MEVRKMTRPSEIDIRAIPLDLIEVGSRLRSLDRDWVATLADSIRENGQQSPIEVVAVGERFRLVFGAHRIGAMRLLQADGILAVVKGTAEVARQLAGTGSAPGLGLRFLLVEGDGGDRLRALVASRTVAKP